jgi:hypothetical protein
MAYSFSKKSSNSFFVYLFESSQGVFYQVRFKPTPYLFGDKINKFSDSIFEFELMVISFPQEKMPAVDKLVGVTVAAIFKDFYDTKGNTISIYICDSSDGKQSIWKRKFDQWFLEYNDATFVKIDEVLLDANNNRFPISVILSNSNPYRKEIFEAFVNIALENNQNK